MTQLQVNKLIWLLVTAREQANTSQDKLHFQRAIDAAQRINVTQPTQIFKPLLKTKF